jgi:hypothetical protein
VAAVTLKKAAALVNGRSSQTANVGQQITA